jgi:very-short-patch-repair endonuclease
VDPCLVLAQHGVRGQGLMSAAQLRSAGVGSWDLTRAVRSGAVVRVRRGVYAAAPLPTWPRFVVTEAGPSPAYVAHVRAVLLSLGSSATACGRTAAALYGWGLLVEPSRTVEVALPHPHGHTSAPRVRVTRRRRLARARLRPGVGAAPIWVTSAPETVVDLALTLPLLEAVVACDSALRAGHVTVEELAGSVGRLTGRRDAARLAAVLQLCDPASGSVLESVLRVALLRAGVTGFTTQRVLAGPRGEAPVRVDFCFDDAGLVVEVDGARWHQDVGRDRARDNALAVLGWRVLRFTWAEVVHEPALVLAQITAALAPARTRSSSPRVAAA